MTDIQQPLVTVVTVAYNSALYVRDAIESVLAQTYLNIEYIIGDDCSTDNTWEIIQEYKDSRIRAYRNETNMGEYPNRNKAIDLATGKYLMFIDGDDIIYPHGIEFFVSMMQAFPRAGMAIQKNYINNILYPAIFEPSESLRNYFYGGVNLLSSSFASNFFKSELLKASMLKTQYLSGDEEIRLRIAAQHPVLYIAGWVSWPRETPGQASSKIFGVLAMKEHLMYTVDILNSESVQHLDPNLLKDIRQFIKKRAALFTLKLLLNGKFIQGSKFLNSIGFSWKDMVTHYFYNAKYDDVLISHSSAFPFKNGFLNKNYLR